MTKSLLTGLAVCAALMAFAANANAYHASGSSWAAKGGPLYDCVHVTFPQCGGRHSPPK
jgi:hypothetical protein